MLRAYTCRLYPNAEQREFFAHSFGCVRWVYNNALAYCQQQRETGAKHPSAFDLNNRLPELKKEFEWLAAIDSQALKAACADLDAAFQHFFRRVKAGQTPGYPRFKSKRNARNSFTATQRLSVKEGTVKIPKLGYVKARGLQQFEGKIKRVTVRLLPSGKYMASLLVDTPEQPLTPAPLPEISGVLGIDLGCKTDGYTRLLAAFSNGTELIAPAHFKSAQRKLRRAQRQLSRKKKGSKNRDKQRVKVARIYEKFSNQRKDFLHKTTTQLVRENQAIAIEDLNVQGMMAAPKPKQENGRFVRNGRASKRGLARSLVDASLGKFTRQLEYKCRWYGVNLLQCGRFEPSSKTCSACGTINTALTLRDRRWTCECGTEHHRDINAAINISRFAYTKAVAAGSRELTSAEIQ
jgi:putative transposase